MKRLFLVLVSSAALSAWGQTGLAPDKKATNSPSSDTTVMVQGSDATTHVLEVPLGTHQVQSFTVGQGELEWIMGSQAGCPVQIVNASFDRPAELLLTGQTRRDRGPTLHLYYENFSGKDIDSVVLTGWLKVKQSPYQLDAVVRPFELTLSRKALLGKDVQASQALKLEANAVGLDRIELAQVVYADGTTWKAEQRKCVFHADGNLQRAEAR